ncbi:MAG: M56 family metallopeptidase [Bacteroidota bacterium]
MIQIIGWAILHSLWQIALITCLYIVVKSLWKKASALQQYYLGLAALVANFSAPILTVGYLWPAQNNAVAMTNLAPTTHNLVTISTTVGTTEEVVYTTLTFADYLTMVLPYLVAFWGLGMGYFLTRFLLNLAKIQKLQNIDNEIITGEWLAKISAFKKQLNIEKEVQVFLSTHIKEPITFGHFKPVILLPISLMTGFDAAAVETILLHELAHIKRHDYLVNLGQSLIEIILFYHPCVWWLSKEIRTIREHCCDDLVLSVGDNRDAYVRTLTTLQWRKIGAVSNSLSMAASGDQSDFTRRIKRMFGVEEKQRFSFRQLMGVFLVLLFLAIGAVVYQRYAQPVKYVEPIENFECIKQISEKEFQLTINEKTTRAELERWVQLAQEKGTKIDFMESTFDNQENLKELRGHVRSNGNDWTFGAKDLTCINLLFNLYKDQILGPYYSYPCREDKPTVSTIVIDKNSLGVNLAKTLNELAKLNIFQGFSMSEKSNFFNGSYIKTDGTRDYIEVEDVAKTPIKITVVDQLIKSIEFINRTNSPLSSLTISQGMTADELRNQLLRFQETAKARISFKKIKFQDDGGLSGGIFGDIRPNKSGRFHFFEVHDLDKYSILIQANADTILAPKYIVNESQKVISEVDNQTSESSKISINHQTTRADLANWANTVTKHGIIFNYENSVFDENDRLIGLSGKFNGQCCFNDAFFVSQLDEVEVHLKVKDNYIYQPTIITNTEDSYEELKEKFWKDAVAHGGLSSANYDDLWMGGAMRKMKIIGNGTDKSYLNQEEVKEWQAKRRDSLMGIMRHQNETPASYIPLLKERKDFQSYVDSVSKFSNKKHSMLIPSDQKTIEAINQQNLLYRGDAPEAIFASEVSENLNIPFYVLNYQEPSIQFDPYELSANPSKNWIYWGDKKVEFSATFREGLNGRIRMSTPTIEVSKSDWNYLKAQPFTFFLNKKWYKVQSIEEIVFVPKKADPIAIPIGRDFQQILQNKDHKAKQLLNKADIGDYIYYERIDVGKDFVFGLVVEIVENPSVEKQDSNLINDINFDNAELIVPDNNMDASQSVFNNWKNMAVWPTKNQPDTQIKLKGSDGTEVFVVDGTKWQKDSNDKLDPESIKSIDVISGTKAQFLYGVPKAVLITTKKGKTDN